MQPEKAAPPMRGYKCGVCGLVFHSQWGFDAHRVGKYEGNGKPNTRRCLVQHELEHKGFQYNPVTGQWATGYSGPKAA